MSDVHSAATNILEGAAVNAFHSLGLQPIAPVQSGIKSEDLNAILDKFSQMIISALAVKSYPTAHSSNSQEHTHDNRPGGMCHGCGQIGHFIQQCPVIEAAITAGKCRRNHEGKVILNTGAFVPRSIPGTTLIERVEEWHRRNPNQVMKGQLSSNTNTTQLMYDCVETAKVEEVPMVNTMRLSSEDRIAILEQEIMTLRKKQIFDGVEITRTAPKHYKAKEVPAEATQDSSSRTAPSGSTAPSFNGPSMSGGNQGPIHPFANIPEAQYVPPSTRNFAAPADKGKEKEPAYRTIAPIQNTKIAEEVYE